MQPDADLPVTFTQIDAGLADDGGSNTILFFGWAHDGTTWIATIELPIVITDEAFLADEWRKVRGLEWSPV